MLVVTLAGLSIPAHAQIFPGTTEVTLEITNAAGVNLGWLVVVGPANVVANGHTWEADTQYWFFDSGSAFPSSFRLYSYATTPPNRDPAGADAHLESGSFDTSTTVTPHSGGTWWTISRHLNGSTSSTLGYLGIDAGDQFWYETVPNAYLPMTGSDFLHFSSSTQPSAAMYLAYDAAL